MNMLEWASALTGLICVWLTVKEHIGCWPIGIVSTVGYVVVFGEQRLYADAGLQVIFILLQLYGWYEWLRGGAQHEGLTVARASAAVRMAMLASFLIGTPLLAETLRRTTDASLPWLDSALTVLSLIAQGLLSYKYIENWYLWITVDVFSIGMYEYKGLHVTAALYAVFLCLATAGLLRWQRVAA
jgi:nicotinamide mononucleotide transporter